MLRERRKRGYFILWLVHVQIWTGGEVEASSPPCQSIFIAECDGRGEEILGSTPL